MFSLNSKKSLGLIRTIVVSPSDILFIMFHFLFLFVSNVKLKHCLVAGSLVRLDLLTLHKQVKSMGEGECEQGNRQLQSALFSRKRKNEKSAKYYDNDCRF